MNFSNSHLIKLKVDAFSKTKFTIFWTFFAVVLTFIYVSASIISKSKAPLNQFLLTSKSQAQTPSSRSLRTTALMTESRTPIDALDGNFPGTSITLLQFPGLRTPINSYLSNQSQASNQAQQKELKIMNCLSTSIIVTPLRKMEQRYLIMMGVRKLKFLAIH